MLLPSSSSSMPLPTPSTSSPPRVNNNVDIPADDNATSPLFDHLSPVCLLYSDVVASKRIASPTRVEDAISLPPKNRCVTRALPSSRRHDSAAAVSHPTVLEIFGDSSLAATPHPSPRSVDVTLSADQSRKLKKIINTLKTQPLCDRRAILPVSRSKAKPPPKKAPVKKATTTKIVKQKKPSKQKKKSILTPMLLTEDIRPLIFGGERKKLNYSYDKEGINKFDTNFQKQLKFRFDKRRQQGRRDDGGGLTTRAAYDLTLTAVENVIRTTNFKELS